MRDMRDWNKYVELLGKAASKRTPSARALSSETGMPEPEFGDSDKTNVANGDGGECAVTSLDRTSRRGRGPRKEETREELLARLLDPTLTLEETARILEVCPTTVRRYTNKGILPHQRSAGNQRRFKLSTVLDFEARMRSGAAEDTLIDKSAA